jgi:hypothetical protein
MRIGLAVTVLNEAVSDRALMESLARFSSSESARQAAAVWLHAFDEALAAGEDTARAQVAAQQALATTGYSAHSRHA